MFILLLVKVNAISQRKDCEKNLVKTFGFGIGKMVLTLLTKIVAI